MIPIFVAIDTPSYDDAENLLFLLGNNVDIKLGLEFFIANGLAVCNEIRNKGATQRRQLFLDLKFHDIPNTVAGAVRSAMAIEPDFLTLHTCDGEAPLVAAARAAVDEALSKVLKRPKLLGVTVLTSLEEGSLAWEDLILDRAKYAANAGLDGLVCPVSALPLLKPLYPDMFFMNPGIRMPGSDAHDQKSIATPKQAMDAGSSAIVVGRDITKAVDPLKAAIAIRESMV